MRPGLLRHQLGGDRLLAGEEPHRDPEQPRRGSSSIRCQSINRNPGRAGATPSSDPSAKPIYSRILN